MGARSGEWDFWHPLASYSGRSFGRSREFPPWPVCSSLRLRCGAAGELVGNPPSLISLRDDKYVRKPIRMHTRRWCLVRSQEIGRNGSF